MWRGLSKVGGVWDDIANVGEILWMLEKLGWKNRVQHGSRAYDDNLSQRMNIWRRADPTQHQSISLERVSSATVSSMTYASTCLHECVTPRSDAGGLPETD
jgi:hypothetical protein